MGIPRRKVTATVLVQSFWVGLFGIVVAFPTVHGLAYLGRVAEVVIPLPLELLGIAAARDAGDVAVGRPAGPAVGAADRADEFVAVT